jgi:hypothetical protein
MRPRLLFLLLLCLWPNLSHASTAHYAFDLLRKGKPIGRHEVTVRTTGARQEVDVTIRIDVGFGILPLYRYRHHSKEVWQAGILQTLNSSTDDNGSEFAVKANRQGKHLHVRGSGGTFQIAGNIFPTSYWNAATPQQTRLLDTQKGVVRQVTFRQEQGVQVMEGDLRMTLQYTGQTWSGLVFRHKDTDIVYRPITQAAAASSPPQ